MSAASTASSLRRAVPLLAWVAGLAGVVAGAIALGATPALAAPPLTDPASWVGWAAQRQPVEAAFALVRLAVVVVGGYLLVATTATVVLALARSLGRAGRAVHVLDVLTLPFVTRLVRSALGVGMVGAGLAGVVAAPIGPTRYTGIILVGHAAGPDVPDGADGVTGPAPTMRRVESAAPSDGSRPADPAPVDPAPVDPAPVEPAPAGAPAQPATEVVLEAGDHLWSVAEEALADALGRSPHDEEIAPYWLRVVAENRSRLADPDNPDLVFPGQVVVLPPLALPTE